MAVTRALRRPARALVAAALAAALCAVAYATTVDTVPPAFTEVPPCHTDPVSATAVSATVECKGLAVTGSTELTVALPQTIPTASGTHTLAWKDGATTTHTKTIRSLPPGTHLATWTASDAAGNASTTTQVIVVQDTTPPALTLSKGFRPPPIEATAENTKLADSAEAVGVSTDPGAVLTTDPETLPVPKRPRAVTVTWSAEDGHGNASTVNTRILIRDTTPPDIDCGRPAIVEPTAQLTTIADLAASVGTSAVDHKRVDPDPVLTADPATLEPGRRATTVEWTATDMSGNAATCNQRIWIRDTTPPDIDCGRPAIVEPTAQLTTIADLAASVGTSAVDHKRVDPDPVLTADPATLEPGRRATTVEWTATDMSGNAATCNQRIWIRDTTPPAISPDPLPPVTIEATGATTTITAALAGVTATDTTDPNPTLTPAPAALAPGTHTVTWTASDASGNTSTATQQVTAAKFEATSLAFNNNGIDITFSKPVDPSTTGGILINKWYLSRGLYLGEEGMISTISTSSPANTVVRIEPDLREITTWGFCTPVRANPDRCMAGSLTGPWLVSLPSTLTSAQGTRLYEGTAPTLKSCAAFVTSHPYWLDNRGVANTPGCVGYVNNPRFPASYTGPAYSIWSDPQASPSGSSSQAAQASRFPLQLSASLQAGTDTITLDWMRGSLPTATYAVERSTDGGAFAPAQVTVVNATMATAPITPADLGSSLSYRMAETVGGVTARFDPVTVTLPASLAAPSSLSATRSASGSSIELDWRDAPIASGYYVEKAGTGGAFERIATVTESSHTVELGGSATGTHEFRVVAYLGSTASPPSATASVTLASP